MKSNNHLSQRIKKVLIIAGGILLLLNLWLIDYEQLFSRQNLGPALGGLSNILIIAAMVVSIRHTKKEKENGPDN